MSINHPERLLLVPNGYPVWLDVAQASIDGVGTAMRFVLPVQGHNLPLLHRRERKLVVALEGALELRSGRQRLVLLQPGEAVLLSAGTAHRIHQQGAGPSTVGAVLWPGRVEAAFREMALAAAQEGYGRQEMIEILARYDVEWTHEGHAAEPLAVLSFEQGLQQIPSALAQALRECWLEHG